jgi:hypothetical protein
MDKIERLVYLITREIEERPAMENFSRAEYQEMLKRIAAWIREKRR